MLNRAADAESQVKLRRNSLSRGTDLAVHREPSRIADRTRGCQISAQGLGELFGDLDIFLFFNTASHGDNDFSLREIDRLLGFFENFLRLVANHSIHNVDFHGLHRGRAVAGFSLVSTERSVLKSYEPRRITDEAHVSSQLALKHLTGENEFAVFVLETDAIADHRPPHSRSQFRNKVAHLIGVRHQHKLRLFGGEHLFERGGEGVGRIRLKLWRFDGVNLYHLLRCDFGGDRGSAGTNHGGLQNPARSGGDSLAGGDGLPGDAVELTFALFDDY